MVLPSDCSLSGGVIAGNWKKEKSKSPLFSGGGGPWLQMTSALVHHSYYPDC